jgi:undecaprenyl diphosphate synthase
MLEQTSVSSVPQSIGFTPDKNRTWAESFGLNAMLGHSRGRDTARTIIEGCFSAGVRDVVFWAMSESNIHKRSSQERGHLVELLIAELKRQEEEPEEGTGFFLCGRWRKVVQNQELEDLVHRAHERNKKPGYQKKRLTVLFGYRGITDIKQAAARVCEKYGPEGIENEDLLRSEMWVSHLRENVEMLVRTGVTPENRHNSDSLLPLHGENAYVFETPVYWPEFRLEHLDQGFDNYAACRRLKGA